MMINSVHKNHMFSKTYNVDRHIYNFLRGSIIIIEGQIGVGKTTLGSSMKARLDELNIPCTFYPETVHAPWLEMFLSDIPKYALGYEMFCTTSRLLTYEKAIRKRDQGHVCIIDRSLDGDMVFAKSLLNRQDMTPEEFEVTRSWSTKASNTEIEPPDYLIYLQTSTQVAINRTAKRDRKGEDKYDIGYFSELNHEYELMMNNISSKRHKLYVDWSNDLELNDDNLLDGKYIDSLVRQIRDP